MSEDRLQALYLEALELDAAGRRRLLVDLTLEAPELAAELARLLLVPASVPSPIDGSPWRAAAADAEEEAAESAPGRVGRFRILRELGRGGMGRVYLAEEEAEHFRRTVALKLIHRPGPEGEAVRRFRDEVRILASLEHPGIARFYDGGISPEGIWYLALEYVDGPDLLEHARDGELPLRARLELFAAVLDAVAYAHGRGVVHRDLKPSNVMVGRDGRPRLLDFGISKLVEPGPDGAAPTLTDWRPLTPAYASPEQFRGERVSPASDVYSLGVVLYELVAGARPFAGARDSRGALERAVLERDPEPPSAAARHLHRTLDPAAPRSDAASGIDRALDRICLKALRREAERRYADAGAFLDDLRRYLAGEPVAAKTGDWRGELRDRLRRHRRGLAAAAGIVLLAAAIVAGVAALRRGESGGAPAAVAVEAARFPFDPTNPPPAEESERRLAEAPEDLVAGSALVFRLARDGRMDEARIAIGRMRQVPGNELEPLVDYAEGRIASVEGEDQRALVFYTRARDRALAAGRVELLGALRTSRAATLSKLGQREASLAELEAARADSQRIGDQRTLYRTLNGLALEHLNRGEMDQGVTDLEDALAAAEIAGIEPIVTLENLAVVRAVQGRPDLGEPLARRLIEHYQRAGRASDEGEVSRNLALMLRDLGRSDEAAALLERALTLLRQSKHGNDVADALHAKAVVALEEGRLEDVAPLVAELEATAKWSLKWLPLGYAHSLRGRQAALAGDFAAVRREFAEARRLVLAGGERDRAALLDLAWAEAEAAAGDAPAALRVVAEALGELDDPAGTEAGYFAETLRARIDAGAGRITAARDRLRALGPEAAESPSLSRRLAFLRARAALAVAEGRAADARADLETAVDVARSGRRKLTELELRIELAAATADPAAGRALAAAAGREAQALGYVALAERARGRAAAAG
jgi:serine/threonine-protein kinase